MSNLGKDLDATIIAAVNARVESEILATMADSGIMQQFVTAALATKVKTGGFSSEEKTLLSHLLETSIQEQAKSVVAEEIARLAPQIREEVRSALAKSVGVISDSLVDGFVANAQGRYPSIEVNFRGRD